MTKGNSRKKRAGKKPRVPVQPKAKVGKPKASKSSQAMSSYHRLISDPCAAPFAAAPYLGSESGYYIRLVDNVTASATGLTGGVIGNSTKLDCVFQYTPGSVNSSGTSLIVGANKVGTDVTIKPVIIANFVAGALVDSFRCVASCVRFVPTGNYADRSGIIGMGYAPNPLLVSDTAYKSARLLSASINRVSIGMGDHEIKWLPSTEDQIFTPYNSTAVSGGTVFAVLMNADATFSSTTTADLAGYFEVTTVYEWVPTQNNLDVSVNLRTPPPFTINDHQSMIKNIGEFLTTPTGSSMMKGGMSLLSSGFKSLRMNAPSLPLLN